MTPILLGAAGQLGRELAARLPAKTIALTRADLDLANEAAIAAALEKYRPDVVINCAAYNLVDRAEQEPELALRINALAPRALARACRQAGALLVHFSTDYVFGLDGARTLPYQEDDCPGPVSAYGLSKLAGEQFIRAEHKNHLILRTCGLYGMHGVGGKGGNFVETMLRVAAAGKPLRVVSDQQCSPTSCTDLAEAALQLIDANARGLFHLVSSGSCSWFQFAQAIFEAEGVAADLTPIPSSEYAAAARRPAYSVLSNERFHKEGLLTLPGWREALAAYLRARRWRKPA